MILCFDVVYAPRIRNPKAGMGLVTHKDVFQPAPEVVWGCSLPCLVPKELILSCVQTAKYCSQIYWQGNYKHLQANAHLGLWLAEFVVSTIEKLKRSKSEPNRFSNPMIQKMAVWIREQMETHPTVIGMARWSGLDMFALRALVQKELGCKPKQFIDREILRVAMEILSAGTTVSTTAVRCGYHSRPAFIRAFIKQHGQPPSRFRRKKGI
jgi:AraC-like DNA-binding protein